METSINDVFVSHSRKDREVAAEWNVTWINIRQI